MKTLILLALIPFALISCSSTPCGWKPCDGEKTYTVFPPSIQNKECFSEAEIDAYTAVIPREAASLCSKKKPAYANAKIYKQLRYWEVARVQNKTRYGHHWYTSSGRYLFTTWEPMTVTARRNMNIGKI